MSHNFRIKSDRTDHRDWRQFDSIRKKTIADEYKYELNITHPGEWEKIRRGFNSSDIKIHEQAFNDFYNITDFIVEQTYDLDAWLAYIFHWSAMYMGKENFYRDLYITMVTF